jgi:hypothetical protein
MNGKLHNGFIDPQLRTVFNVLFPYQVAHPNAQIDVRRRHGFLIRVRIIVQIFKESFGLTVMSKFGHCYSSYLVRSLATFRWSCC